MHMIVVMIVLGAGSAAESIFGAAFIIEHLMKNTLVQKRAKSPVNGYPVVVGAEAILNIGMREGMVCLQKQVQYLFPVVGMPQGEIP